MSDTLELAEASQRVEELNQWIFRTAVGALSSFELDPDVAFQIAINVSPAELASGSVTNNLADALLLGRVDASRIVVELSERLVTDDADTHRQIDEIAELGVGLALDDFGEGRTSLGQFSGLPVGQIKLDRLLIDRAVEHASDRIILESVTKLAHELDTDVVAEGIETAEHRAVAVAAGVDLLQGFGLHRPMPYSDLRSLLLRAGVVRPGARSTRTTNSASSIREELS